MDSERYSDVLQQQLKPAIQTKRQGLLSSGMSAHDNIQPHTACHTVKQIYDLKLVVLLHLTFHQIWHPVIFTSSGPCTVLYIDKILDLMRR